MQCSNHTDDGCFGSVYENQLKLGEVTLGVLPNKEAQSRTAWEQMRLLMWLKRDSVLQGCACEDECKSVFAEAANGKSGRWNGHLFLSWDKAVWKYPPGAGISGASDKDVALLQHKGGSCTPKFLRTWTHRGSIWFWKLHSPTLCLTLTG